MSSRTESKWTDPYLLEESDETSNSPVASREGYSLLTDTEPASSRSIGNCDIQRKSPSPEFSDEDLPSNDRSRDVFGSSITPPVHSPRQGASYSSNNLPATGGSSRVVIAIDYGTTYTGLAVAQTHSGHANLNDIEVLQDWGENGDNQKKVRTMISYVKPSAGQTQWGSAVSDHATAMVNTKLELEPQASRRDELELTLYLLMGTGNLAFEHLKKVAPNPAYTSAPPGKIVEDYLRHIRESACREGVFRKVVLSKLVETKTPVDIVVTVPAKWSFQATEATFKAIRGAGFNKANFKTLQDTILVSEPEAASFFAVRDHQATTNIDLRVNDCFIICDAGGGTVDVVSYQVTKVKPHLEIEKATEPDSRKCGSAFIDTAFKNWLREELGVDIYGKLDPLNTQGRITAHTMESGPIRKLVQDFIIRKQEFSEESGDVLLDLPEPLEKFSMEGRVRDGELTIYSDEMQELFDQCINDVIELLDSQIKKLKESKNRKARNVFLVGGFGASPYLQYHLEDTLGLRRTSTLRRPNRDKSVTAVVQGAVIYGIEKSRHGVITYMSAVEDSYAICHKGLFHWLIRKGDLILSTEKKSVFSKDFFLELKSCPMRTFEVPIYKYIQRDEDDDEVPDSWEDGQHDVTPVDVVKCDVSAILDHDLRVPLSQQRQNDLEIGPFRCHFQLSANFLEVQVLHKRTVLAGCEIPTRADAKRNSTRNEWG